MENILDKQDQEKMQAVCTKNKIEKDWEVFNWIGVTSYTVKFVSAPQRRIT